MIASILFFGRITLSFCMLCVLHVTYKLSCIAAKEPQSVAATIFHSREPKYSCFTIFVFFLYITIWPALRETLGESTFTMFVWRNHTSIIGFLICKFTYHYYETSWETKKLKRRLNELRGFPSATMHPFLSPKTEKIWLFALSIFRVPATLIQILLPEYSLVYQITLLLTLGLIIISIIEIQWGVDHNRYYWRSEIKTVATICCAYFSFYIFNLTVPAGGKLVSMEIESLEFFLLHKLFSGCFVCSSYILPQASIKLSNGPQ